jgi:hypothetical protein
MLDSFTSDRLHTTIYKFIKWLNGYGETSHDYQSFYAGSITGKAKEIYYKNKTLGTVLVSPIVFCEAFLPSTRRFFYKKLRFPIADAHYAMGFTYLFRLYSDKQNYRKAQHFLNVLEKTRSPYHQNYCWGYPFDWSTKNGTKAAGTPFITSTPYGYEAFKDMYLIDKDEKRLGIMHSIAEHAKNDIKDIKINERVSTCGYGPYDNKGGVINANAYRAFLLTDASIQFSEEGYWEIAEKNLNFVLDSQQEDGSWYYERNSGSNFVDHFHTCFVLKALAKIERLTHHPGCRDAIQKGVAYYVNELFDERGLPKPFSRAPRLTIYKKELYDYAECINLGVLLRGRFKDLDDRTDSAVNDILNRWQKPDGSFRSRKLYLGWDNVPMHRWAQSQLFRSLCLLLYEENKKDKILGS